MMVIVMTEIKFTDMNEYESTFTFKFKEYNWKLASKSNIKLLQIISDICEELDIEVECKRLKEKK